MNKNTFRQSVILIFDIIIMIYLIGVLCALAYNVWVLGVRFEDVIYENNVLFLLSIALLGVKRLLDERRDRIMQYVEDNDCNNTIIRLLTVINKSLLFVFIAFSIIWIFWFITERTNITRHSVWEMFEFG